MGDGCGILGTIKEEIQNETDTRKYSLSYTRYLDKTQVFTKNENDHVSKRITHVQLVSKIARTIGRGLNLNEDLIEAASLGHDLGHPGLNANYLINSRYKKMQVSCHDMEGEIRDLNRFIETNKRITDKRVKTYERNILHNDRIKAFVGTIIGTAIPVILMMKEQGIRNPIKLKYKMTDMVKVSAGSILGGVGLGLINENKQVKKDRLKEGLFQFMNAVIPTCIVGGLIKLCETSTQYNNKFSKILCTAGGLLFGMFGSAALANLITDPMDKHPDRKVTVKDALINVDDGLGALALAKFPLVDKLNLAAFFPLISASCGYRTGKSN